MKPRLRGEPPPYSLKLPEARYPMMKKALTGDKSQFKCGFSDDIGRKY